MSVVATLHFVENEASAGMCEKKVSGEMEPLAERPSDAREIVTVDRVVEGQVEE